MHKLSFLLLLVLSVNAHAQLSIENLLSAPFPSDLNSSPDGNYITWVFNDKGVRNVWVADVHSDKAKAVTHFTEDDGQEITSLAFTPDNKRVIFVRGNSENGKGEAANPSHLQTSAEETVFIASVQADSVHKIGKGTSPAVSFDGKFMVYADDAQIWIVGMDSLLPKKLFQSRGSQLQFRWSPQNNKLAFVSRRSSHSFIGIYDFETQTFAYPDAGAATDAEPAWSADGKWLAYIRVPYSGNVLPFTPLRSAEPWSIRLLNVSAGAAQEIWKADEGAGSAFPDDLPVAENLLWFTADGSLVFPWEKEGWMHLYALNITTRQTKLLTPGEGEVEHVTLSNDKKEIIYSTNINDISHRHIYKTAPGAPSAVMLSEGDGIEAYPAATSNGVAVLHSSAKHPLWPAIISSNGKFTDLAEDQFPKNFPSSSLVVPQVISITATDGMQIPAQIFLPPNYNSSQKYPALIFFHGGSRRQMLPAFHYMFYYSNSYALNQYFASQGYIVLSVNYRSGIGYGLNFREALNYGAGGASEVNDVIGAGLYLKSRPDIDAKHIALWGGSYGGYLTAFGLAKASDLFACGVDIHGVHDWNSEMKNWISTYDPRQQQDFAKLAYQSSPIAYADSWRSPVLFIHGDDDRNVPFDQTLIMAEKLKERKVYYEELILPDEIHDFLLHRSWLKVYNAAIDFINSHLSGKQTGQHY
ncbi:S9 family peptidase [Parafilimonas sp.]|uniref:S9 family peptidase n=1 Tax=Parafilimonas sp. TaxID=1969739 RepID=UPI0039E489FA